MKGLLVSKPHDIMVILIKGKGEKPMRWHIKHFLFWGLVFCGVLLTSGNAEAKVVVHDVSTPQTYTDQVINVCTDMDNIWGSQCVDLFSNFHYSYTGRWLSAAGTDAAYGLWDAKEYNAGDDYDLITNPTQLQYGDWVVFDEGAGEHGHVGMAYGGYENGTVLLLGENQGGVPCEGGGSQANVIRMSLEHFRGAFRPRIYTPPASKVESKVAIKEEDKEEYIEAEEAIEETAKIITFNDTKILSVGTKL